MNNIGNNYKMQLRNGKCIQQPTPLVSIKIKEKTEEEKEKTEKEKAEKEKQIKIMIMNKTFLPHIKTLVSEVNDTLCKINKTILVCEIYSYIYDNFKKLYELKCNHSYSKFINTILKRIPELTQQCIIMINENREYYDAIDLGLKCIKQMAKVQELANQIELEYVARP